MTADDGRSPAVAAAETLRVVSGGTEIELLVWGERGRPGLLLVHGAGAHAHWWSGVAPWLAQDHRVAAMSLPGNGGSQWRDRYSTADVLADALACVSAAALDAAGAPVCIGHSIGGAQLMHGAVHAPAAMRGLVLVDSSFRAPGVRVRSATRPAYASQEEAIAHFRLMPPGPARRADLVALAARQAVVRTVGPGGEESWSWRADPDYWAKFERGIEQGPYSAPLHPRVPTVLLVAEESHVAAGLDAVPLAGDVPRILLPACGHHVLLDRPLVLVAALRSLLAVWPTRPGDTARHPGGSA